ncbi:MAG TPA: DUF4157 domain-containing protein, partial [Kofleriaceae bacterium]|nr:DUF4157 domain-containing protein [Kofleriaceae bacterium]
MREVGGKRSSTTAGRGEQPAGPGPGPGKRTLTETLPAVTAPVQRKTDADAAGQRREAHAAPESRPSIKSLFGGQRKPMAAPASAEPASEPERHEVLDSAKAQRFGAQLGADFSGVTIHRGDGVAHDHGAAAIAFARDIHFAPGMYETGGDGLLGHELVHTVQQHGVPTTGPAPRQ